MTKFPVRSSFSSRSGQPVIDEAVEFFVHEEPARKSLRSLLTRAPDIERAWQDFLTGVDTGRCHVGHVGEPRPPRSSKSAT